MFSLVDGNIKFYWMKDYEYNLIFKGYILA